MKFTRPTHLQGPIARGTLRTSTVLGLRLAVQTGTLLLVARMLGPQQFGAFAGIAALAVILGTLATFGTHLVLLREVSKDPAGRTGVLPYALPTTLVCGSALLAIYLLICSFILSKANVPITVILAIGVTETLLQPLFALPVAEQLALGRIARSKLLQTLPLALRLLTAILVFLLVSSNPLRAYGYGYFLASLLALAAAIATMPAGWPTWSKWRRPSASELRDAAGYAALNITATGPAELDKTLATKLLPLAASGVYIAGARVVGAATLPVIAMMVSALPRLFREGQGRHSGTAHLLRWIFFAAVAYSIALAVLLWFVAPVFVWAFGAKYHGIESVIHWLTLAIPGMALRIAAGDVLMTMGKPWMRVGFEVTGLTALVIAAAILASPFGKAGMSVALAGSEWAMALLGWWLIHVTARAQVANHP